MQIVNLKLPEFAFLDGQCHEGDTLEARDVVLHIRSASIIEFFVADAVNLNDDVLRVNFIHRNIYDIDEPKTCALHHCATLDVATDEKYIIDNILRPAISWYCDYMNWEDGEILKDLRTEYLADNN